MLKRLITKHLNILFEIFKNSLIEGHPGLYDYITPNELEILFFETEKQINKPLTSEEFKFLLIPIIKNIKDSHTAILSKKYKFKYDFHLPILFGLKNDSLECTPSFSRNDCLNSVGLSARIASAGGNLAARSMAYKVPMTAAKVQKNTEKIITSIEKLYFKIGK